MTTKSYPTDSELLDEIIAQACAQFKCGDRHLTISKQTVYAIVAARHGNPIELPLKNK